ncbi:MAG TPA: DUF3179 domain-containing (seleno)protein [Thermoanaerobaculia bacterium]
MRGSGAAGAVLALLTFGCFAHQYRDNPRVATVDGDAIVQMKPLGELPSALEANLVPAPQHSDRLDEFDRVVGLVVGSEARAYPIGLLDRFEVVDDAAGGRSFVVVRCPLAGIAGIYDRRVGDRVLSFENSGALWRDTLVMRDRETGSYWTAATGKALSGPLAGAQLEAIPAPVTRVEFWERTYAQPLYLDLGSSTIVPFTMRLYEASPAQGVSGSRTSDHRRKPKEELFVLREGNEALALTEEEVRGRAPVAAALGGKQFTIEWDAALETPRAFEEGLPRSERALIPMYWFALNLHFATVRTLADVEEEGSSAAAVAR